MQPIVKHWKIHLPPPEEVQSNLKTYSGLMRQILFNRGITTEEAAEQFLAAQPPPGTDPFLLLGMTDAVERIQKAIHNHERIVIYGDYDADGVTATALLSEFLRSLGAQVSGYIPNRFDEGYGLNIDALDGLYNDGVNLVITVDCGIRSLAEAEHAMQIGLDLIITDHHNPQQGIPKAVAIINPKQPGDVYPDKNLAGVGLAYKLAQAIYRQTSTGQEAIDLDTALAPYLDLVALGTVTDLAPLVGENRALVRAGMNYLREPTRQGLMSLIGASGLSPNQINAEHIGFVLGPRLNAAGRLDSAQAALDLLLTQDVLEAGRLAQILDDQNRERQQITRDIQAQAEQMALQDDPDALLLFAAHESFNPGVVGLAASRLTEQYYRPAIVVHLGDDYSRGSCRSIPEFHITKALDECADLLVRHGGHAAAAGFTVENQNLPELIERIKMIAQNELASLDLQPTLRADVEIPLSELKPEILYDMARLEPTGQGNPRVVFVSRNAKVIRSRTVGRDDVHLKFSVRDGYITYDAIAFRQGYWQEQMPEYVDLMYVYEVNEYNGQKRLQLNVRDLKPSE